MEGQRIDGKLDSSSDDAISHLSIDIGGSLIKIVYFSTNSKCITNDEAPAISKERQEVPNGDLNHHILSGRLYFVKFETSKIEDCIKFLSSKKLQQCGAQCHHSHAVDKIKIKATGGGAFKFADLFRDKLGITLDKVEEMESLVAGANFLLKAVNNEAYTYIGGQKEYVQIDQNDLYPYLLVNIGSGVSMIKVDGDEKFHRVSGTSVGGGTFLGLGKLLTKCQSFDELLELSHQGNNRVVDMLVGDIYGGLDYSKIGLTSTAIASSFGKAISENKELEDYKPEDIARSLLRMISNNIGQIAYLNALRFGLKRIFLGGFFIRDHAYTMDTISVAVDFWSKGEAKAMFLRHEGFLGALGAFMNYKDGNAELVPPQLVEQQSPKSSSCIVDRIHNSTQQQQHTQLIPQRGVNSTRVQENENGAIDCRLRVSSSFKIYDEVKRC
ncbi:pantothenate kinase 1 [Lycium barbarum]|uniref:pantothenate kinase 1 n=1 Tax=Lycium barbarum TaxID=112863 RepID=UPI00293E25B6|nr:pantothenate kinase 1 [Lycium barbarum]